MQKQFLRELRSFGLPVDPVSAARISAEILASLPEPAQRYLHFMRVIGRPPD